jgi:two-component system, NarL family, nitrate/nitrite response regulator NarL
MLKQDNPRMGKTVLLCDDHVLVGDAIESLLTAKNEFAVWRANDLRSSLNAIKEHDGFELVLLDVDMPGMNGIVGVEKVIKANANGRVVIFSGTIDISFVSKSIGLGARGYIPKTLPHASLHNALNFILTGEVYVPSGVALTPVSPGVETAGGLISNRELTVLKGIAEGMTNKAIAAEEKVSEVTIKMHVRSLCKKMRVTNRTQIAIAAIQAGIVNARVSSR